MGMNLLVFLARDDRSGQRWFPGPRNNGGGIEQVSRALLRFLLSGELMRGHVLLPGDTRTELILYPVERIVERDSERRAVSVNYSNGLVFTHPLRGTHCT